MMMQMLHAGGLEILTDAVRTPDGSNPKGYFELEAVKDLDKGGPSAWLAGTRPDLAAAGPRRVSARRTGVEDPPLLSGTHQPVDDAGVIPSAPWPPSSGACVRSSRPASTS